MQNLKNQLNESVMIVKGSKVTLAFSTEKNTEAENSILSILQNQILSIVRCKSKWQSQT